MAETFRPCCRRSSGNGPVFNSTYITYSIVVPIPVASFILLHHHPKKHAASTTSHCLHTEYTFRGITKHSVLPRSIVVEHNTRGWPIPCC